MSHLLLSLTSYPFESLEVRANGLVLRNCNCTGVTRYFIPRPHIDYVSSAALPHLLPLRIAGSACEWIGAAELQLYGGDTILHSSTAHRLCLICCSPSPPTPSNRWKCVRMDWCCGTATVRG